MNAFGLEHFGLEQILSGKVSILEACRRGIELEFCIETPPSGFAIKDAKYVGGVFKRPLDLASKVLGEAAEGLAASYGLKASEGAAQLLQGYGFRTQMVNEKLLDVWYFWGSSPMPIALILADCFAVQKDHAEDHAGLKKPDCQDSATLYDAIKALGRLGRKTRREMADVNSEGLGFSGTDKGTIDRGKRLVVPRQWVPIIKGPLVVFVTKPHGSSQLELVVYDSASGLKPEFPDLERVVLPNTYGGKDLDGQSRISLADESVTVNWISTGKIAYFTGHGTYFIISGTEKARFPSTGAVTDALEKAAVA